MAQAAFLLKMGIKIPQQAAVRGCPLRQYPCAPEHTGLKWQSAKSFSPICCQTEFTKGYFRAACPCMPHFQFRKLSPHFSLSLLFPPFAMFESLSFYHRSASEATHNLNPFPEKVPAGLLFMGWGNLRENRERRNAGAGGIGAAHR